MKEIVLINLFWILFYGVYYFWLRKESYFQLNRIYLLCTLIGAVLLVKMPLPELGKSEQKLISNVWFDSMLEQPEQILQNTILDSDNQETKLENLVQNNTQYSFQFSDLLYVYYVISGILAIRFMVGILAILRLFWQGKKERISTLTWLVYVPNQKINSFSFLRFVFLHEKDETVLKHELAHIQQAHSLDILLVETLLIFFWWNPILWAYRHSLRLTHEFLADKKVTATLWDKESYAKILMEQSMY